MGRDGRPEAVPLHATERNPARETRGGRTGNVAARLGTPFMPWQRMVADIAGEIDPATGGPWYREVDVLVLRQAGKTTLVRAKCTEVCAFTPNALVRYTAQNRLMGVDRLEHDFYEPLAASPLRALLNHRIGARRRGMPGWSAKPGAEHIAFANGARWTTDAVKAASGHGPSLDLGAIDEAFAHEDGRVEASMRPGMITRAQAQMWVTSAAGEAKSSYLRRKAELARERAIREAELPLHKRTSRVLFVEYAAPRDADRADPATWWATHPALGYTITEAAIAADFEGMSDNPEQFDRAYLGWWPERKIAEWVIGKTIWERAALAADGPAWDGEPVWSIDVAPARDIASIGMAGKSTAEGARVFVDVIERRGGAPTWTVERLIELRARWGGNHVGLIDAARSLTADLEEAGFEVHKLTQQDKQDACGGFYDDALADPVKLRHVHDEDLDDAIASAVKRHITTDGGFVWARKPSLRDITPLYAATVARWLWVLVHADDYDVMDSFL